MEKKNFQILIYRYMMARIHYGFYPEKEPFPSIHSLGRMFHVSTMTIRCAYKMLEEDGYILMVKNKRPVLTYTPAADKKLPSCLYTPEQTFQDLYQSLALFLPSIFCYGLFLCEDEDLESLNRILDSPGNAWDEPVIRFLSGIVSRLRNPLLADLYYDILLYSYPFFLSRMYQDNAEWQAPHKLICQYFRELLIVRKEGNFIKLQELIDKIYQNYQFAFVPRSESLPAENFYRWSKPQISGAIAGKLIYRIFYGIYPAGAFLPSASALAEEFSAALITMRRTIKLLNDLGMTESINGRGTRVLSEKESLEKVSWLDSQVQKKILSFLRCLQILAITCRKVAEGIIPHLKKPELLDAVSKLRIAKDMNRTGLVEMVCLDLLLCSEKYLSILDIYEHLLSQLIWGYPLSYLPPAPSPSIYADGLMESLEAGDSRRFSEELEKSLHALFYFSRKKMVSAGIKEAGVLDLPAVPFS
ncbi:GntR family transcriptional regulator [Lacrimispora sp. NSJ-141]|uniref:GntR family transcriptional regulator n=1 Tax=Lientehia hominis TaxID=2897778 RepID=A0AAP2RH66_9FIRM|nr:GntR family transcriptional regulator [Lientehia hominis]MCD2491555.1 GntR family transcriptional regulator [Lientehia hominis]